MDTLARFSWAFGAFGLFCFTVFASLWWVTGELGPYATGFGIAAGLLLSAYAALDRENVADALTSRSFVYGSGAMLLVLLVGAINVFAFRIAKKHDHRWDLTEDRRFSLSDHTAGVLAGLEQPVEIYAFFRNESAEQHKFRDLLDGFTGHTDKLTVHWLDPLRDPLMAQQFAITTDRGTVVLVQGESRQRLETAFDESAVTNALIRLVAGEDHRICWSVGHGEADPDDDRGPDGYGAVVVKLEDQNYTVTKTQVLTQGIDRACEALVIARPVQDWLPLEREALAAYLAEGGRVLAMLEPETVPELSDELERYGVRVGRDLVLDTDPQSRHMGLDESFLVLSAGGHSFAPHPITDPLRAIAIFGIARSVSAIPQTEGLRARVIAHGSAQSWGETDLTNPDMVPDEGIELIGDVPVMVVVEIDDPSVLGVAMPDEVTPAAPAPDPADPVDGEAEAADGEAADGEVAPASRGAALGGGAAREPLDLGTNRTRGVPADFAPKAGGRLVVAGDADFASNQLVALGNNQDLFLNSIAWLVEEDAQLGERPETEPDALSLNVIEGALLLLVSIVLVPGAAVVAAIGVTLRRRFL